MTYPLSELSRIRTRVKKTLAFHRVKQNAFSIALYVSRLQEIDSAIAILSEHQSPRVESLAKDMEDNYFG